MIDINMFVGNWNTQTHTHTNNSIAQDTRRRHYSFARAQNENYSSKLFPPHRLFQQILVVRMEISMFFRDQRTSLKNNKTT